MKITPYNPNKQKNDPQINKTEEIPLPKPLYKAMPSNLIHFRNGQIILGNNILHPFLTFSGITLMVISLITLIILQKGRQYCLQIIFILISYCFCSLCFIKCLITDPGIIPKQSLIQSSQLIRIPRNRYNYQRYTLINKQGCNMSIKFCESCCLYRSSQIYHCSFCDVCIIGADHHCLWLGKCIGRYNYKIFIYFLLCLNTLLLTEFLVSITLMIENHLKDEYLSWNIINMVQQLIGFVYIFQLTIFHFRIIYRNQTTRQYIRDIVDINKTKGIVNFKNVFERQKCQFYYAQKIINFQQTTDLQYSDVNVLQVKNGNLDSQLESKQKYTGNQQLGIQLQQQ